jgi:hypothetical protein
MRARAAEPRRLHCGHHASNRGFADVGYDEALRRARELIPFLREQAPKCEELRRMTRR